MWLKTTGLIVAVLLWQQVRRRLGQMLNFQTCPIAYGVCVCVWIIPVIYGMCLRACDDLSTKLTFLNLDCKPAPPLSSDQLSIYIIHERLHANNALTGVNSLRSFSWVPDKRSTETTLSVQCEWHYVWDHQRVNVQGVPFCVNSQTLEDHSTRQGGLIWSVQCWIV